MESLATPRRAGSSQRVLPRHARAHNLTLLLRTLFHGGAMSRADLARETGLTRVTTSDLVAHLLERKLVVEKGVRAPSGPGKPAVLVDLDRQGIQIVALDLAGADENVGALMDLTGAVLDRRIWIRASDASSDDAVGEVVDLARSLVDAADGRVLGVGVGSPGIISEDGQVLEAPNFGWEAVPLRDRLEKALNVPTVVGNDANAAALAEYTFGQAEPDMFLVRVGRGVGGALLVRGELVVGSAQAAGEIGHVQVGEGDGPECACGKTGCLEAWLSIPQLTRMLEDADAAHSGGGRAQEQVLREAGGRLALVLAPIVGALNLSDVVIAAPHELFGGTLLDAALEKLRSHTLSRFHTHVRLRVPLQSEDLVLQGGLVMVLSAELGVS
ncbi:ROK family transcriptional regulator [Nesterenkonia halophila]